MPIKDSAGVWRLVAYVMDEYQRMQAGFPHNGFSLGLLGREHEQIVMAVLERQRR